MSNAARLRGRAPEPCGLQPGLGCRQRGCGPFGLGKSASYSLGGSCAPVCLAERPFPQLTSAGAWCLPSAIVDSGLERLLRKIFAAEPEPARQRLAGFPPDTDQSCQEFALGDPVRFRHSGRSVNGHIARKTKKTGLVVTEGGRTFSIPWPLLIARSGAESKRVVTPSEAAKARFRVGDRVEFTNRGRPVRGKIVRMNPKTADVDCDSGAEWRIHYQLLNKTSSGPRNGPAGVLEGVAAKANRLMAQHGLKGWSFQFDDAARRAGACCHSTRVISLAREYCLAVPDAEWTNTMLHEIAHALVGPGHHHDAAWKRTARSIGCTADRCHSVTFTPPRYILSCPRCRWAATRLRRKRRLVCRECGTDLVYDPFSAERWARMRDASPTAQGRT